VSHISLVKISIRNPNISILRGAVKALAKDLGGELVTEVEDYYGNKTPVPLGVRNAVFPRGVGITVEDGQVRLKGDFFDIPQHEVTHIQNCLVKNYTALATINSLRSLGYQVSAQKVKESVFIKAVVF